MSPHSASSDASRRVLVTGITGQDGYYLAGQLRAEGAAVFGLVRTAAAPVPAGVTVIEGDLRDAASIERAVEIAAPEEIYHLAAATFVAESWRDPAAVREVNVAGTRNLADIVRGRDIRLCHASSAEIFGAGCESPLDEQSPIAPVTPYGQSKAEAHRTIAQLRERDGVFACSAILFNHESPRRPPRFVTRKITLAAARIAAGLQQELMLGDVDVVRDWGYAPEYTDAMRRMIRSREPRDYVVATGRAASVADFARLAFERVGLDWRRFVRSETSLLRTGDARARIGDASAIRHDLRWQASTTLEQLVEIMVDADVELVRSGAAPSA
jgi:GDPmannose 4,6-dehydratase